MTNRRSCQVMQELFSSGLEEALSLKLKDNEAAALDHKVGSTSLLKLVTTNNAEAVNIGRLFSMTPQTIAMDDAQVALVLASAGAGEVQLVSSLLFVDAESAGTEDLLLPPEASSTGLIIIIVNTGGESIVVKEDGDSSTIVTIATGKSAIVACDGTTWYNVSLLA